MKNFNVDDQLLDIITVDKNGVHLIPKNPVNILWFIENCDYSQHPQKEEIDIFLAKLKAKTITEKTRKNIYSSSPVVYTFNENMVLKRVADLIEKGLDINKHLDKFLAYKSLPLVIFLVSKGLNLPDDTLYRTIELRHQGIAWYVYSLKMPQHKEYLDKKQNNIAHAAVRVRNYGLLDSIIKDDIELLYAKNKDNKSPIDYIFSDKNYHKIVNKKILDAIVSDILKSHHNQKRVLSDNTIQSLLSTPALSNFAIEYSYLKLDKEIANKDEVEIKVRKI